MKTMKKCIEDMTNPQLQMLVSATNNPNLIASILNEAYQELTARDNLSPGIFSDPGPKMDLAVPDGTVAASWLEEERKP